VFYFIFFYLRRHVNTAVGKGLTTRDYGIFVGWTGLRLMTFWMADDDILDNWHYRIIASIVLYFMPR
jgi:hypothetical protein